jgi:molybdenum cofactor cytidylyltransferase
LKPPTLIILASGPGERFRASGGTTHKLAAILAGKTVLEHVLAAARATGLPWHLEEAEHPGMGDSIAAAVAATRDAPGWLILPGDLPLIRSATIQAVAAALDSASVVVPTYDGRRGHPVGFTAECLPALLALSGQGGAAAIVRAQHALELVVDDLGCVTDIDTLADLERAEQLLRETPPG